MLKRTIFRASNFSLSLVCAAVAMFLLSSATMEQASSVPAVVNQAPSPQAVWSSVQDEIPANAKSNSMEEFLNLTPRKVKAMTGEKMSVKEVIALKIAQKKLKKAMSPGAKAPAEGQNWAGIVSLIMGSVGLLAAGLTSTFCLFTGIPAIILGIMAVIFGIIGLSQEKGKIAATIGLILGAAAIVLALVLIGAYTI